MSSTPSEPDRPVLVTGASGYIGSFLAAHLRARGYGVRALVRSTSAIEHLRAIGAELVEGDVRDPDAVARAMAGCRHVIHLAGLFRVAGLPDAAYRDVHVGGTRNLLAALPSSGVERLVHVSTIGVHGDLRSVPGDEDSPYNPGDIYQQTKLEAELEVQAAIAAGRPATICRPAGVYGPNDERHLKLFRLLQQGRFIMFGQGRSFWHPVWVEDLVEGLRLAAETPAAAGRIYILPGPSYVTLDQWVRTVAAAVGAGPPRLRLPYGLLVAASAACETLCRPLGVSPPLHRRRAAFFVNNRAFLTDRAAREIGFRPRIDIEEGVSLAARSYVEAGQLAALPAR